MVHARDLIVGRSYIYINNWKKDKPETNLGELLEKGVFRSPNTSIEPLGYLKFKNGNKSDNRSYNWDDEFREVKTTSGGKRKTRRNRKSRKLKKSKSRKNRKKSNRRR